MLCACSYESGNPQKIRKKGRLIIFGIWLKQRNLIKFLYYYTHSSYLAYLIIFVYIFHIFLIGSEGNQ